MPELTLSPSQRSMNLATEVLKISYEIISLSRKQEVKFVNSKYEEPQLLLNTIYNGRSKNPEPEFVNVKEPRNRYQGTNAARLCSLAGRYDNPSPTRFLATADCLKISAVGINSTTRSRGGGGGGHGNVQPCPAWDRAWSPRKNRFSAQPISTGPHLKGSLLKSLNFRQLHQDVVILHRIDTEGSAL